MVKLQSLFNLYLQYMFREGFTADPSYPQMKFQKVPQTNNWLTLTKFIKVSTLKNLFEHWKQGMKKQLLFYLHPTCLITKTLEFKGYGMKYMFISRSRSVHTILTL